MDLPSEHADHDVGGAAEADELTQPMKIRNQVSKSGGISYELVFAEPVENAKAPKRLAGRGKGVKKEKNETELQNHDAFIKKLLARERRKIIERMIDRLHPQKNSLPLESMVKTLPLKK